MSLKKLIDGHYVKNIIQKITGEYNEDLEQEVYLRVWKNSDKYKEQGNGKAWVRTITANITKDWLKSSQKKLSNNTINDDEIISTVKDSSTTPELRVLQSERQKIISNAINSLRPKLKEVVLLYEIENKSYEEISQKLKCPIGTVKSRLYNAKQELAVKLQALL